MAVQHNEFGREILLYADMNTALAGKIEPVIPHVGEY
jgi:hypothetical protein